MYSGLRMSEVIYQVTGIPFERIAVLSGPNLAREIAGGQAAASVVAPDETAPHDGGRTGAQKAARPSFSCSDLSHVIRGSVSTRCRGTRQVSRREFLSGPLRRGKNGSFLCTVWAARPGGQHPRGDPPRVAGDHDQHRRPPDLAEAQRDVRGREPQVALTDLARLIDGPRGRIRGPIDRPQIRIRSLSTVRPRSQRSAQGSPSPASPATARAVHGSAAQPHPRSNPSVPAGTSAARRPESPCGRCSSRSPTSSRWPAPASVRPCEAGGSPPSERCAS